MELRIDKKASRRFSGRISPVSESSNDENTFTASQYHAKSIYSLANCINPKNSSKRKIYLSACELFKNETGACFVEILVQKKGKLVIYAEEHDRIELEVNPDENIPSYCVVTKEKVIIEHPNSSNILKKFKQNSSFISPFSMKSLKVINYACVPIFVTYN